MRVDKIQISGSRFMFSIAFFLQSSVLLTAFIAGVVKHDAWLPVLFSIILGIPLIYLYRTLMVMFPDKSLLQVMDDVYGPAVGKMLGIAYLWFFLTISSLNLSDLADFAKITVMTETPHPILMLLCVLLAVWTARNGINVTTQYGELFTIVQVAITLVTFILLYNQIELSNFLPLFSLPFGRYLQSTHISLNIPLGELVLFLMFSPNVKMTRRQATKYWFGGFAIGMFTLLAVLMRDISILGDALPLFTLPGLVSLRLVSLGEALSRMEILFAVALMMLLFFKVTVLCYASTVTLAHILKTSAYRHLTLIVGIFLVVYAPVLYPSTAQHNISAVETVPFIWSIFQIVLPFLTFIIAKIRKLPNAAGASAAKREV